MQKRRKVPWPIMKTRLTKECRDRFGRHSLRPARRSFGRTKHLKSLERVKGIEPSYSAWKAAALPLSYTRARPINYHAAEAASTAMHDSGPSRPLQTALFR